MPRDLDHEVSVLGALSRGPRRHQAHLPCICVCVCVCVHIRVHVHLYVCIRACIHECTYLTLTHQPTPQPTNHQHQVRRAYSHLTERGIELRTREQAPLHRVSARPAASNTRSSTASAAPILAPWCSTPSFPSPTCKPGSPDLSPRPWASEAMVAAIAAASPSGETHAVEKRTCSCSPQRFATEMPVRHGKIRQLRLLRSQVHSSQRL